MWKNSSNSNQNMFIPILHQIGKKSSRCILQYIILVKPFQIIIDGKAIPIMNNTNPGKWGLTSELEAFRVSENVQQLTIGGNSFKGSFYPFNLPARKSDSPIEVDLKFRGRKLPIDEFITYRDVFVKSAPFLSSKTP